MDRYTQWLKSNGATFDAIDWPCETVETGRGAIATKDVLPNESFLTVPSKLIIDPPLCRRSLDVGDFLSSHQIFIDSEEITVAFFLCHERLKGKVSFWEPYIEMLPKDTGSLTMSWSKKELDELQDDFLVNEVKMNTILQRKVKFNQIRNLIEKVKEAPFLQLTNLNTFTFELFSWGLETVFCRSFGRRLDYVSLVPLADNLNHNNVQTKYSYSNGIFKLFPTGNNIVKKGQEVFNSYGRRPNGNLLASYGFALENNEWDDLLVDLRLPENVPLYDLKKKLFLGEFVSLVFQKNMVPNELLKFFRAVVATEKEIQSLVTLDPEFSYTQFEFLNLLNERAMLNRAIGEVESIIESFPTSLVQDLETLKTKPSDMRYLFALRYRIGRKQCLKYSHDYLTKLQKLVEDAIINHTNIEEFKELYFSALSGKM